MNTTWHWRAYGSNLLSQNFLHLIKSVLNENGVAFYNTTQSIDAFYTAKQVFPRVYKYKFFVLASMKNPLIPYEQIPAFPRKPELITDDNMITEFKYGKGL